MPRIRKFPELHERIQATPPPSPSPPTTASGTRRSARQQLRQSAGVTNPKFDQDDFEYEVPHQHQQQRKRRFLDDPSPSSINKAKGRKVAFADTPATAINRLINKNQAGAHGKPSFPANRFKPVSKLKPLASIMRPPPPLQPSPSTSRPAQQQGQGHPFLIQKGKRQPPPDPDWLPVPQSQLQANGNLVNNPHYLNGSAAADPNQPKKRGRKKKVDLQQQQGQHPIKYEIGTLPPGYPEPEPQQKQQKRGRQAVATGSVKPRFPFCTLCLSKDTPSDYIINHMSGPNEYQRMKRVFNYIYKDLKFPFVPFDLERENVFDYCDLPLCDNCFPLYREIYDSFATIENAKSKIQNGVERMVGRIRKSNKNPQLSAQVNMIANSTAADSLMNKYSNFRKRFENYKPGKTPTEVEGPGTPATIARVRIMCQVPKRTSTTQTIQTFSDHFVKVISKQEVPTTSATAPSSSAVDKTIVKLEIIEDDNNKQEKETPSASTSAAAAGPETKPIATPASVTPPTMPAPKSKPNTPPPTNKPPGPKSATAAVASTSTSSAAASPTKRPGPKSAVASSSTTRSPGPKSRQMASTSTSSSSPTLNVVNVNGQEKQTEQQQEQQTAKGKDDDNSNKKTSASSSVFKNMQSVMKVLPPQARKPVQASFLTITKSPAGGNGPAIIRTVNIPPQQARIMPPKPTTTIATVKDEPTDTPAADAAVDDREEAEDPFFNIPSPSRSNSGGDDDNNDKKDDDADDSEDEVEPELTGG